MKKLWWAFLIIPLVAGLLNSNMISVRASNVSPYIAVTPQLTDDPTIAAGKNYTISIYTDYNGTDVWGWEFTLAYDPRILEGIAITNGDLISTGDDASAAFLPGTFDNDAGKLTLTGAVFMPPLSSPVPAHLTSGPGTLANVTFKVVGTGGSNITLGHETRLIGISEDGYGQTVNIIDEATPLFGHLLNGYFKNTGAVIVHDLCVSSVALSSTTVKAGEIVNITVVVKNNGTETETFDVKVYYDQVHPNWLIGTKNIPNLGAGETKSTTFAWNTTINQVGNHTITAVAETAVGETHTADNTLQYAGTLAVETPSEGLWYIWPIIIVVVVIIVIVALALYITRRRKK